MRVLGIDCGTERTGWGVIQSDGRRHAVIAYGVIVLSARDALCERLAALGSAMRLLLEQHAPQAAAVEEVFFSQNVKTALKLAHVRGVVLAAIAEAGVTLGEYSALSVKSSVVGYGRAEKGQVQLMVRNLTGQNIESEDAADAVAVAICHATRSHPAVVNAAKVAAPDVVAAKVASAEAGAAEVVSSKVGAAKIAAAKVGATKVAGTAPGVIR